MRRGTGSQSTRHHKQRGNVSAADIQKVTTISPEDKQRVKAFTELGDLFNDIVIQFIPEGKKYDIQIQLHAQNTEKAPEKVAAAKAKLKQLGFLGEKKGDILHVKSNAGKAGSQKENFVKSFFEKVNAQSPSNEQSAEAKTPKTEAHKKKPTKKKKLKKQPERYVAPAETLTASDTVALNLGDTIKTGTGFDQALAENTEKKKEKNKKPEKKEEEKQDGPVVTQPVITQDQLKLLNTITGISLEEKDVILKSSTDGVVEIQITYPHGNVQEPIKAMRNQLMSALNNAKFYMHPQRMPLTKIVIESFGSTIPEFFTQLERSNTARLAEMKEPLLPPDLEKELKNTIKELGREINGCYPNNSLKIKKQTALKIFENTLYGLKNEYKAADPKNPNQFEEPDTTTSETTIQQLIVKIKNDYSLDSPAKIRAFLTKEILLQFKEGDKDPILAGWASMSITHFGSNRTYDFFNRACNNTLETIRGQIKQEAEAAQKAKPTGKKPTASGSG